MKNLTQPRIGYRKRAAQPDLHTGCEGIVTRMPNGDEVRWHIGNNGWFYINGVAFGVGGMPPANHAAAHHTGGEDALTPADIGAATALALEDLVAVVTVQGEQIEALQALLSSTIDDLAAITEAAVISTGIRTIEGTKLPDGVGKLHYTTKPGAQ